MLENGCFSKLEQGTNVGKELLLTVRGRTESERVGYYLWQCVQGRWNIPDRSVFSAVRIFLTIVYSALLEWDIPDPSVFGAVGNAAFYLE